jgi:alpha-1,6-mannosyltransferase
MTSPSTSRRAGLALGSVVLGYLLVGLVAGAADSPLVPVLPRAVGRPEWTTTGSRWFGLHGLTRTELTVLSIVLLAGVLAAFFVVLVEASRGRLGLAAVLLAVAMSLAVSVATPVMLSRDVYSYAAYGRMYALHDANPFVRTPAEFPADPFVMVASPAWVDTRAVYGPAFVLAGAGISRLWQGSPAATLLAFKLLSALGALLAALLAARAADIRFRSVAETSEGRSERAALAAAVVGLNPVIVVHTVGGAHNDALIAALLAGALVLGLQWHQRSDADRRPVHPLALGATALLTLAGLIKVIVFPVLALWLWYLYTTSSSRDRRVLPVALHAGAAVFLSAALAAPFLDSGRALTSLLTLASVEGWASPVRLVARGARALGEEIGGSGVRDAFGKLVVVAFFVVFVVVFIRLLVRWGRDRSRDIGLWPDAGAVGTVGLALALPYLLPWYAAWFLPFVAVTTERGVALIGLATAGLLALTGIPAESGSASEVWRAMVLVVHYVVAPLMLVLFVAWMARASSITPSDRNEPDGVHRMADRARP